MEGRPDDFDDGKPVEGPTLSVPALVTSPAPAAVEAGAQDVVVVNGYGLTDEEQAIADECIDRILARDAAAREAENSAWYGNGIDFNILHAATKHGQWERLCAERLGGLSKSTIERMIRAAALFRPLIEAKSVTVTDLPPATIAYLVSAKAVPAVVKASILKWVKAKKPLVAKDVRDKIAAAKAEEEAADPKPKREAPAARASNGPAPAPETIKAAVSHPDPAAGLSADEIREHREAGAQGAYQFRKLFADHAEHDFAGFAANLRHPVALAEFVEHLRAYLSPDAAPFSWRTTRPLLSLPKLPSARADIVEGVEYRDLTSEAVEDDRHTDDHDEGQQHEEQECQVASSKSPRKSQTKQERMAARAESWTA